MTVVTNINQLRFKSFTLIACINVARGGGSFSGWHPKCFAVFHVSDQTNTNPLYLVRSIKQYDPHFLFCIILQTVKARTYFRWRS